MGKKIAAWIIAILVIIGPFRWAFLDYTSANLVTMLSFVAVLAGIFVFYYLTMDHSGEHHH